MKKLIAIIVGEPNSISSEIIFKSWKLRNKYKRESKEAKMRGRVYNRLYRFGKLLGESMRTGNFAGVCGLTGECDMGYGGRRRGGRGRGRGRGCGANRMNKCPTRFATYLGPPHIVGMLKKYNNKIAL